MKSKRPVALMTVAQVICGLAAPITLVFCLASIGLLPNYVLMSYLGLHESSTILQIIFVLTLFRDLALGACLTHVEIEAIRICGRVKTSSAFSETNVTSLGRIVKALTIAGSLTLLLGNSIIPYLLTGLPTISPAVEYLLLPFTLLTLALMARAVQVLMRRAVDMQDETDLTI